MSVSDLAHTKFSYRMLRLPVASTFTCVMGTAGLGLLWRSSSSILGVSSVIGEVVLAFSGLVFAVLLLGYVARMFLLTDEWLKELQDNLGSCFTGAIPISGSLMAAAILPYSRRAALVIWLCSAIIQMLLLIVVVGRWIKYPTDISQVVPLWLIPMVGNAAVSFAGVPLGFAEICWAMLAAALACWLFFTPAILHRLILLQPKLAPAALPVLAILVSAPAVIAVAWHALMGSADVFFTLTMFTALFFALVLLSRVKWLLSGPFSRAWWALTFPSTALASALVLHHNSAFSIVSCSLGWGGLIGATAVLAMVWFMSVRDGLKVLYEKE